MPSKPLGLERPRRHGDETTNHPTYPEHSGEARFSPRESRMISMTSSAALPRRTNSPTRSTRSTVSEQDGGRAARIHSSARSTFSERTGSSAQGRRARSPARSFFPSAPTVPRRERVPAAPPAQRFPSILGGAWRGEGPVATTHPQPHPLDVFRAVWGEHGGAEDPQPTTLPQPHPLDVLRAFRGEHGGGEGP